jgi:fatty acid desaturase
MPATIQSDVSLNEDLSPQTSRSVAWYRTPLESKILKSLHERSDFLGWLQTLGHLGLLFLTGGLVFYGTNHWPIGVVLLMVFLYGTVCAFYANAVHELVHRTVFKTKFLNGFFLRIFAFLGWHNFEMFDASHMRHHRYTLHAPDDLEVVLPYKIILKQIVLNGIINHKGTYDLVKHQIRIARARFSGEWELKLFPEGSPERRAAVNWARTMLAGHGIILGISIYFHLWFLPVLTTFNGSYGNWLAGLCNHTQHIGLQDDVPDFRLCCRTFTVNPFVQFLCWHMNYHIEHHMYAAVPCYKLGQLHRFIRSDLAPCPHGIIATWKEIADIQKVQELNPGYQYVAPLPNAIEAVSMRSPYVKL